MSKQTWVHWMIAAILVVAAGAIIAAAEERIEVRVEKHGADEISVDVNGVTEVVRLEDLADGESRTFDVGDHELVVKRVGDNLTIVSDGHAFGAHGEGHATNIWVTDDGEEIEITGDCEFSEKKMIVMKVDGDDVVFGEDMNIEIDEIIKLHGGGDHQAVFISEDGNVHHPSVVGIHGGHPDMVKYRCEESGSVLLVKTEDAYHDTYICPATGCVMTKVEEPEVKVITIKKKIEIDEEE